MPGARLVAGLELPVEVTLYPPPQPLTVRAPHPSSRIVIMRKRFLRARLRPNQPKNASTGTPRAAAMYEPPERPAFAFTGARAALEPPQLVVDPAVPVVPVWHGVTVTVTAVVPPVICVGEAEHDTYCALLFVGSGFCFSEEVVVNRTSGQPTSVS